VICLIGIIVPLPQIGLRNRKRSAGLSVLAFVMMLATASFLPEPVPPTPEELEAQRLQQEAELAEVAPMPAKPPPSNPAVVTADTWTDGDWPLTIDGGVLTCTEFRRGGYQRQAVFIADHDGEMWPLNGVAKSHHARFGAKPELTPIWRVDQKTMDAFPNSEVTIRISVGPLIKRGLSLCD